MKLIFKYFKPYWIFALTAPLMMFIEVFMDLMLPTIMARIVDEGVVSKDLTLILELGMTMLVATAIAFIGGAGCSYLASRASTGLGANLRQDLLQRVLELSHQNLDHMESGNLIVRLTNDVSQLEDFSKMMLRIMVRAPLQIIGSLIMAIHISQDLSLLFAIFIPLLVITMTLLTRIAYPLFYKLQDKLDKMNTRLQENLAGKRLVKAFVRESYEKEKFHKSNQDLTEITIKANRTVSIMNPLMQILMNGGIIAALWFGSEFVDCEVMKIGSLIAFINYLRQLLFSLMMFSNLIMRFSRAQASSRRIMEVLNSQPAIKEAPEVKNPGTIKGALEFRNVCFSYRKKGDPVLKNISFSLKPGEILAIIGATGSGKSTVAQLLPRFYDIDSGDILIDDKNIQKLQLAELRKQIAVVPQETLLFSGTVLDNILYHYPRNKRSKYLNKMKKAAAIANIDGFLEGLPQGYETDVNQKGVNLSGGQKQRIAIARALAKEAPVIILDDATSSVDMATERRIYNALKQHNEGNTLIIIAQRISTIHQADKILVLDEGEISGLGTHKELLKYNSIYQEIYYSQIDGEAEK